jgi:hypothetical protein
MQAEAAALHVERQRSHTSQLALSPFPVPTPPPHAPHAPTAPPQEAQRAIQGLNNTPCGGGAPLEVKFADADAGERNPELSAPPSDNLYCKNLPTSYTDEELSELFRPHGTVLECKLLHRADNTQVGGGGLGAAVAAAAVAAAAAAAAAGA